MKCCVDQSDQTITNESMTLSYYFTVEVFSRIRLNFRDIVELDVQGVPCPRGLGFVDLDLGCSTTLLEQ